jgi:hypothetical protein
VLVIIGDCVIRLSATVLGQRISTGLPQLTIPGDSMTQLWDDALKESSSGESMEVDEAAQALTKVILRIVYKELQLLMKGERGAVVTKLNEALEFVIRTVRFLLHNACMFHPRLFMLLA